MNIANLPYLPQVPEIRPLLACRDILEAPVAKGSYCHRLHYDINHNHSHSSDNQDLDDDDDDDDKNNNI